MDPFQVSMNIEFTGPFFPYPDRRAGRQAPDRRERLGAIKLPPGQRAYVELRTNDAVMTGGSIYFSLEHQGSFPPDGREVWTAAESARLYGSGVTPAFFHIVRNPDTGKCWFEVSLVGHLSSLP